MATLKAIKNSLTTILEAVEVGGDTAFTAVYDYPVENIEGGPICVLLLEDGDSDFDTNRDNQRTDIFRIDMAMSLELPSGVLSKTEAIDNMYDLIDAVRDALDASQDLSGSVLYMNPSAGQVRLGELQNGVSVIGTVRVAVRHLHSLT